MAWHERAVIYEVNTWVWLAELSGDVEAPLPLDRVPAAAWDRICLRGVTAVWLMGVWERSPAGVRIGREDAGFQRAHRAALPDFTDRDVVGSPYCVRAYEVDARLGGRAGLAAARAELARRGLALVLDFVPNHVAPDHDWVSSPERLVLRDASGRPLHARDPYFPPWPDVVQLDASSPALRAAVAATLVDIGGQCDAVRCDMAMLVMDDVFQRTWAGIAGPALAEDFWPDVFATVKPARPGFGFLAEAYWDLEAALLGQGFDGCYDKRLYDRLVERHPADVRAHLGADLSYQLRMVRFVENHDEPRAAAVFDQAALRAAMTVVATLPGTTLWHEGEFDGRRAQLPVLLGRRPVEVSDPDLRHFAEHTLAAAERVRRGNWAACTTTGWADNQSHEQLLAWRWAGPDHEAVVVVNFAEHPAQGRVHLGATHPACITYDDLLSGASFERDGGELDHDGLYVDLPPYGAHVLVARA